MLLIIFLGLIAKLMSVSRGCDIGPQNVKNFNFNKFSGVWYWLLHTPNALDDDFECPITAYAKSVEKNSTVSSETYLISHKRHVRRAGEVVNIDSNGHWEEIYGEPYYIRVPIYIMAVDYDRYAIVKYCMFRNTKSYTFVMYRSLNPDQATVKEMLKKLKGIGIDANELIEYRMENCQEGDWSMEEVPLRDTGIGN